MEAYMNPQKASRKPQGSFKNFQGRNPYNSFVGFLVQTMTPKRHFEINWPLVRTLQKHLCVDNIYPTTIILMPSIIPDNTTTTCQSVGRKWSFLHVYTWQNKWLSPNPPKVLYLHLSVFYSFSPNAIDDMSGLAQQ